MEAGADAPCAMAAGELDPEGWNIVDMALSIANSASTWSHCSTAVLAWMTYAMADDGLATTPLDDLTPPSRTKVSDCCNSASAALH